MEDRSIEDCSIDHRDGIDRRKEGRRFFGARERFILYASSDGHCEGCGAVLTPGFHADHVHPHARGGSTDIANAQALCADCNIRKAAKVAGALPATSAMSANTVGPSDLPAWTLALRPWQQRGLDTWHTLREQGQRSILVTACPASGKTSHACRIAHDEIRAGRIDRVVVVVPSLTLKSQWGRDAGAFGLRLTAGWGNGAVGLPADVHGCTVTYSQIASLPEAVRLLCARHRVLAVLDEVHHAGDGLDWGGGLRQAFEHACGRLCLSGTPWRGDANAIPFVRYDPQGHSVADVSYPYAQALRDGTVRELYFFTLGGQVRWLDGSGETSATFDDRLDEGGQSKRLRAALDAEGQWLPDVLARADDALRETRRTHAGAKGFAVCMDAQHARATASLLARITGERPALALSDDPDAASVLDRFRWDGAKWLVVCKMAGEGYDNPHLRVCVWGTNVISELYFRQVTARTIRVVPGLPYQDAVVFLPADPRLLAMARAILSERARALGQAQEVRPGAATGDAPRPLFVPLESQVTGTETVTGGEFLAEEALLRARQLKAARPGLSHMPEHAVAAVLTQLGPQALADLGPGASGAIGTTDAIGTANGSELPLTAASPPGTVTYDEQRRRLRQSCVRLAAQVARAAGVPVEVVHRSCHRNLGFRQTEASIAQLERKERVLKLKLLELNGRSMDCC